MKSSSPITHDLISQRAHSIWERTGNSHGSDVEQWLQAEHELNQKLGEDRQHARDKNGTEYEQNRGSSPRASTG